MHNDGPAYRRGLFIFGCLYGEKIQWRMHRRAYLRLQERAEAAEPISFGRRQGVFRWKFTAVQKGNLRRPTTPFGTKGSPSEAFDTDRAGRRGLRRSPSEYALRTMPSGLEASDRMTEIGAPERCAPRRGSNLVLIVAPGVRSRGQVRRGRSRSPAGAEKISASSRDPALRRGRYRR
jgi:hypothetical protein